MFIIKRFFLFLCFNGVATLSLAINKSFAGRFSVSLNMELQQRSCEYVNLLRQGAYSKERVAAFGRMYRFIFNSEFTQSISNQ
jgi:hypothetical protein